MADKKYKPSNNKKTTKKTVEHPEGVKTDSGAIQIHFGNAKRIELKLLEAIAKNTYQQLEAFRQLIDTIKNESKKDK